MIYIIIWLFLCVVFLSYALTYQVSDAKKTKWWSIKTFLTAWLVGITSPFIVLKDMIERLFHK